MNRADLINQLRLLATPLDLDALVEQGVLRKVRASYEVLDPGRLPEEARAQATQARWETRRDGSRRLLLKFARSNASAARAYKRATSEKPSRQ
jgi:hypothetical protein